MKLHTGAIHPIITSQYWVHVSGPNGVGQESDINTENLINPAVAEAMSESVSG